MNWRVGLRTTFWIMEVAEPFAARVLLSSHLLRDVPVADGVSLLLLDLKAGDRVLVSVEGREAPAAMEKLTELFTIGGRLDFCPYHDCPSTPILVSYDREWIQYGCSEWHAWCSPRDNPMRAYKESQKRVRGHA